MKHLYMIGGPMGVGKTAVCQQLKIQLDRCAFLDGDWCWDMHPFVVNQETKAMVLDNICHLLNNFLKCSVIDNVVFCWVMHQQEILDDLLSWLDLADCQVKAVSLVCTEETLRHRLQGDIDRGIRSPDILERSVPRLALYAGLKTVKIDTTGKTPGETAEDILKL